MGVPVSDTLKDLPPYLRVEITSFLYADFLTPIPMFRGLSRAGVDGLHYKMRFAVSQRSVRSNVRSNGAVNDKRMNLVLLIVIDV